MRFAYLTLLVAAALAAQPPAAPDRRPELWLQSGLLLAKLKRTDIVFIGGARSGQAFENWYDYRAGLLFTVRKPKALNLRLGYLWRGTDTANNPLQTEHRFFAGPVIYLHKNKPQVRLISLYERFMGRPGRPDFNRQRHRIDIERSRLGPTPFVSTESFLEETSFVFQRSRAGLRFRERGGVRIDAAYQFETRLTNGAWAPRHAAVLIFNRGIRIDDI